MAESSPSSHARSSFAQRLAAHPLLLDGATGTLLYSRGIPQRASLDELTLARPEMIVGVHREYTAAGADIIENNTFGADSIRLAPLGLADRTGLINRRAAQLAREAREISGRDVLVAGSVGPVTSALVSQRLSDAEAATMVAEQVEGLLEGGVDLVMIETAHDLAHLLAQIEAARGLSDVPIVASMTFGEDLCAADGTTPAAAAAALHEAGADVLGVNCGSGPLAAIEVLEQMRPAAGGTALLIMPNAGLPQRVEGRSIWAAEPAYFATAMSRFAGAGASVIGGCCGTTPQHLEAMRRALDRELAHRPGEPANGSQRAEPAARVTTTPIVAPVPGPERVATTDRLPAPEPTGLARALEGGRFVVSVEIDPPRSVRIERTLQSARLIKEAGADLVNVSDSAMARVRMGAMAVGFAISRDCGLEALIHVTTRDRNLMALESELLGAHALGLRDILALTGDPPRIGDYPGGTGIWDTDSTGLIAILARLNRGEDQAGRSVGAPAGFTIACALDPTAADLDAELDRLAGKIDAGAHLIMTQPIYAAAQWTHFMERASSRWGERLPRPVLLGVLPLHSARHAEFLHNEVPGITIPDDVRAAMQAAGERGAEVGLESSMQLLSEMRPLIEGTYVMPSFGRYEQSAELVRRIRSQIAISAAPAVVPS